MFVILAKLDNNNACLFIHPIILLPLVPNNTPSFVDFSYFSFSSYKCYVIILDEYSHYSGTSPLHNKSVIGITLQHFYSLVLNQFHASLQ